MSMTLMWKHTFIQTNVKDDLHSSNFILFVSGLIIPVLVLKLVIGIVHEFRVSIAQTYFKKNVQYCTTIVALDHKIRIF